MRLYFVFGEPIAANILIFNALNLPCFGNYSPFWLFGSLGPGAQPATDSPA